MEKQCRAVSCSKTSEDNAGTGEVRKLESGSSEERLASHTVVWEKRWQQMVLGVILQTK